MSEGEPSTRERLLDAALEVYLKLGWQSASLTGIARRAGLTTGAIYVHFKGKNELFTEVCALQLRAMEDELAERMAGADTDLARLAVLKEWFRTRRERAGVRLIYDLWHQAAEYPKLRRALSEIYDRMTTAVQTSLSHHIGPRLALLGLSPRLLAVLSTALMEGLLLRQFLDGDNHSLDEVFDFLEGIVRRFGAT